MKPSKYNYTANNGDGNIILYNILSDQILITTPPLASLWQEHQTDVKAIADIHPAYYEALQKKGFIVDDTTDETTHLIDRWSEELYDNHTLRLTINPTLDCNFRCWYCYEEHKTDMHINEQTLTAIYLYLHRQYINPQINHIEISFFGGEPLLHAYDVVLPLIKDVVKGCEENNKSYHISFTTNGFLLTPDIVEQLKKSCKSIFFQITLDGNEVLHNRTRFTTDKKGSYQTIVNNAIYAAQQGMEIYMRLNYTDRNITSMVDILDDFEPVKEEVKFDFHKVWQVKQCDELEQQVENVKQTFRDRGFNVEADSHTTKVHCYADYSGCYVINYNGDVYRCTARDFKGHNRIGILTKDGEIIAQEQTKEEIRKRYDRPACYNCIIFPICHAGCSQDKLEYPDGTQCLRFYDENEKIKIITGRIKELTKSIQTQQNNI